VADEELLAASVTPEYSHLLEAHRFLAATLFYCYCTHVLILDCWQFFWQLALRKPISLAAAGALREKLQSKKVTPLHLLAALLAGSHNRVQALQEAGITEEKVLDAIRREDRL
jgi:Clp amino terminal domain, pathogenicity island component